LEEDERFSASIAFVEGGEGSSIKAFRRKINQASGVGWTVEWKAGGVVDGLKVISSED